MYSLQKLSVLGLLPTVWSATVDPASFSQTEFDFIVVGGGPGGTTVATRLSEIANFTVGLIEAGGFDPNDERINIPQGTNTGGIQSNPFYSWNFQTTPQKNLNDRSMFMARGKVLGGSTAINLMGLFLAGPVEYDEVGQLGNPGWNSDTTLKYYKKATNFSVAPTELQTEAYGTFNPKFHGNSGPVHQSFSSWYSTITLNFFSAMRKLGYLSVKEQDISPLDAGTVWNPPLNIDQTSKTRSYAASAYYLPNAARSNLHLLTNAQVTKINLASSPDSKGNYAATGVTYVSGGQTYTVNTKKEVIVSCGAVQSPQVLELSGIGKADVLEKVGIKPIINLPGVGENYQEHTVISQAVQIKDDIETWDIFANSGPNATAYAEYENSRTGPYTSSINAVAIGTASQVVGDKKVLSQWLQGLDKAFNASNPSLGRRAMYEIERKRFVWGSTSATYEFYCAPVLSYGPAFQPNKSFTTVAAIQLHPMSRGTIHITSADPLTPPAIDTNVWDFVFDQNITVQGVKYAREKIFGSPEMSPEIVAYVNPVAPKDDAEWVDWTKNNTNLPLHPCCTNAMLPKKYDGVVDPTLKVYGTSNIRVVDASVMPFIPATHLTGTIYAIAEQASDIIKKTYGFPTA